jgi:SpoVK/Ycf46/Vps4 family AAA+-type ATPase
MGEKLLAQRILMLLRDTNGRESRRTKVLLEWAGDQRDWLWPGREWADLAPRRRFRRAAQDDRIDWATLPMLAEAIDTREDEEPRVFACVEAIAHLLGFDPFERQVLKAGTALDRLPRLSRLQGRMSEAGEDMVVVTGRLAGAASADAASRVRRCAALTFGFLAIASDRYRAPYLDLHWRFDRLLDEAATDEARLIEALAGIGQAAALEPADFAEQGESFGLLRRMLAGAVERRAAGVNILIHGPPGTGKTELARTLAAAAGAELYAVGEADPDGGEPDRADRLFALRRAQQLLSRRGASLILFDEMEDLFAEADLVAGGGRRAGSKIFVNRLLEANKVPTIWTSNDIEGIDPAHLRRLSYVLRVNHPPPRARARIAARAAEAEQVPDAARGLDRLLAAEPEAASIARIALRGAGLAGGSGKDAEAVARSLLLGLRGERTLPLRPGAGTLDLGLYESDPPIESLVGKLCEPGAPSDFSLLLTGPPGTGKTALAAHVADRLERPLSVKRASDLLSKWVGGTEANIADAFAEARDEGSVLLLDEVDSLLLDRSDARQSWEVTQVNELLTWMDSHPLPFIAATNWARRLDPAALRRFVFKIELATLSPEAAARAWRRFFDRPPPAGLAATHGLTPGDFAVVARQLRYRPGADAGAILAMLAAEARARPEMACPIGF